MKTPQNERKNHVENQRIVNCLRQVALFLPEPLSNEFDACRIALYFILEIYAVNHGQRRLIGENELAACGCNYEDTALVALSGGADSTALLLSLHQLLLEGKIRGLFAAHLNHGIRGESAQKDEQFCVSLCNRLEIPITIGHADVPAHANVTSQTLEQAARELRYAFLEQARVQCGASIIATAHHRDDQAETLLLHLIRGSGMTGLSGMKARNGCVIRPMLKTSRAEILSYLAEQGQSYCEDETNAENVAARNRIRNELLPLLSAYNPAICETLAKTAELLAQDDELLNHLADEAEREILLGEGWSREKLMHLELPIASRIVRKRLYALCGSVSQADIRRVLALLTARTGTCIELSCGFSAWTDAQALFAGTYPHVLEYEVTFVPQGETTTPRGAWTSGRTDIWHIPNDGYEAYLDFEKLPKDLVVRTRRAGDRFYPLGAPGERKLSDVLTDKKIAKEKRDLQLLASGKDIYFICGMTISERVKVTSDTREILHIICNRGTRD